MDVLNQNYMAKSKKKADLKFELLAIVAEYTDKLTVKQLKELIAKYA